MNDRSDQTRPIHGGSNPEGQVPPSTTPTSAPTGSSGLVTPPAPQPSNGPGGPMMFLAFSTLVLIAAVVWLGFTMFGGDEAEVSTSPEEQSSTSTSTTTPEPTAESAPETNPGTTPLADNDPPSVEDLARSVVQIHLQLNGQTTCTGSGTIVSADGLVLTNSHVVTAPGVCPRDTIVVGLVDRIDAVPDLRFEADLLVDRSDLDLAVVRIARTNDGSQLPSFTPIPLADEQIALGDELQILGFPGIGGDTITATTGTVSGFVEDPAGGDSSWIKTDAVISGGNSGGLAANPEGQIVGIPTIVGTGDGPVVDCRFLADSNGDGTIDGNDSCVPTGGFINGIRPISFARPLLTEAATAQPIALDDPTDSAPVDVVERTSAFSSEWSLNVNENGEAVDLVISGNGETTLLCLTWQYDNLPAGAPWDLVWLVNGQQTDVVSGTNQGGTSGGFFGCFGDGTQPLPTGFLEAQWFAQGELVFGDAVYNGPGRQGIEFSIANQSIEPLCSVFYVPAGSNPDTFGTNRLFDFVDPGETATFFLARGNHTLIAIDCLGNVVVLEENVLLDEATGTIVVS